MQTIARSPGQLGSLIYHHRQQRGLTQTQLGAILGMTQKTISKLENGNPAARLDTLFHLLAALDLELTVVPRSRGKNIGDIF